MTISISNDGSYFSIGYIDYNYIAPDILVLGATSVSSVAPSLSLSLNLTALSTDVGSLGIINTSTGGISLVGIESISQLGSLRLELSDNTNPNQINANVSSVSIQLSTNVQSSNLIGNIGSVGKSNVVTISSVNSQSDIGSITTSTDGSITLRLSGLSLQSYTGNISKLVDIGLSGTQSVGYVNSLLELDSILLSSNVVTTGLGTLGYTKSDSIRLSQTNSVVSQGTISTNVSISVSGITSYGLIQSEIPVEVIVPSGNEASIYQGILTVSSSSVVNLTSVLGTTSIHSVDSVVSRIATSYQLATNVGLLSISSDIANTGISSTIVQQPIFATHTLDSTGYQIQSVIGSIIKSFGVDLYVEPLVGYTGNLNKYSTTSIFGSLSSISNGNIGTNLLASIYNPTLITSFGYLANFIESDDIYYYGPIQFELINSNIIPFTVSLPIETRFDDTKEIETKFNTVFTLDTEFKNTKSFKGVCL